jgi:hypothetical protein
MGYVLAVSDPYLAVSITTAAFLKGDRKRDDDSNDEPWELAPKSTGWLAG